MNDLEQAIREAATEGVRKRERSNKKSYDEAFRRNRRSRATPIKLTTRRPYTWDFDKGHNPYHVRAHADSIAHAINAAIRSRTYAPLPPAGFRVAKPGGGTRLVTTFAIADEVISKRLYSSLMNKNRARLSARSYAYRKDLGVHDAIAHIVSEWSGEHRLYVAQYDFSDYFGSIDHEFVLKMVDAPDFAITRTEGRLLRAFLSAPAPTLLPSRMPTSPSPRTRGVHQGTTISLLLANLAATPLDREFEKLGVSFARYADDIVIWSRSYDAIGRSVEELHRFAEQARCEINHPKSEGIRLLTSVGASAEFRSVTSVSFLSHKVGLRKVSLSDHALRSAKRSILRMIYNNLIREPLSHTQRMSRLNGKLDRDYIALVSQLRRFLYGSLGEASLRRLLKGPLPSKIQLGGLLGRHPLVNDVEQLRALDGWIAAQVWMALQRRAALLGRSGIEPWDRDKDGLTKFMTRSKTGRPVDGRLPSAVRMSALVTRAVNAHGTRVATHTTSLYAWGP